MTHQLAFTEHLPPCSPLQLPPSLQFPNLQQEENDHGTKRPSTHFPTHLAALRGDPDPTPLQEKLNDLAELVAKIGGAAGLILFISLMICFFVQLGTREPAR